MVTTTKWVRKPFYVDAIPVTSENMNELARWCGGAIEMTVDRGPSQPSVPFIKVDVRQPANPRQTRAFPGDWLVRSGRQFKVYTEKAFKDAFEPVKVDQSVSA